MYDDMTWSKRDRDYDTITWESAQRKSRASVVEHDETNPLERDTHAGDMLGAAGLIADRVQDAHDDPYADDDLFFEQ